MIQVLRGVDARIAAEIAAIHKVGLALLAHPDVHRSDNLAELLIGAERFRPADIGQTVSNGETGFSVSHVQFNLSTALRESPASLSVPSREAAHLAGTFDTYTWSETPQVWRAYVECRRTVSRLIGQRTLDPRNGTSKGLSDGLSVLLEFAEVQDVDAYPLLAESSRELGKLEAMFDVQPFPDPPFWGLCQRRSVPVALRSGLVEETNSQILSIAKDTREYLIQFGLQYRELYIRRMEGEGVHFLSYRISPENVAARLVDLHQGALVLRHQQQPEDITQFDDAVERIKKRVASGGRIFISQNDFALYLRLAEASLS